MLVITEVSQVRAMAARGGAPSGPVNEFRCNVLAVGRRPPVAEKQDFSPGLKGVSHGGRTVHDFWRMGIKKVLFGLDAFFDGPGNNFFHGFPCVVLLQADFMALALFSAWAWAWIFLMSSSLSANNLFSGSMATLFFAKLKAIPRFFFAGPWCGRIRTGLPDLRDSA